MIDDTEGVSDKTLEIVLENEKGGKDRTLVSLLGDTYITRYLVFVNWVRKISI